MLKTPIIPCSFSVDFKHWFDFKTEQWCATITYGETRQGKQYGGRVVDEYQSGTRDYNRFMKLIRQRVNFQLKTFWT